MALWVNDGTVAVTTGSASVVGTGTTWQDTRVIPGNAFRGPDGRVYEILQIVSNTALTLASNYEGATAAGQPYSVVPVPYAYVTDLLLRINELIDRLKNTVSIPALLVGAPSITDGVVAAFKGARMVLESAASTSLDIIKGAATDTGFLRFFAALTEVASIGLDAANNLAINGVAHLKNGAVITPGAVPGTTTDGQLYYDSVAKRFRARQDGVIMDLVSDPVPATFTPISIAGNKQQLICDPTNGSDFNSMALWSSGINRGGRQVLLTIAPGLHNLATSVTTEDRQYLRLEAETGPAVLNITGATFSVVAGSLVEATVALDPGTPLPVWVTLNWPVIGQHVKGDGSARLLSNAHNITWIAPNRLSYKTLVRWFGVALAPFTTPDNFLSFGSTFPANKILVPSCALRPNQSGWDGTAIEGFLNAKLGSQIDINRIGISYDGVASQRDLIFCSGQGSAVNLKDYCALVGAGQRVIRIFDRGHVASNRSGIGGGDTAVTICQTSAAGGARFTGTWAGSCTGNMFDAGFNSNIDLLSGIGAGAPTLARTTHKRSAINMAAFHLAHGTNGWNGSDGLVSADANSEIRNCTTPMVMSGAFYDGNPLITGCTNPAPTANQWDTNGGGWNQGQDRMEYP